MSQNEKKIDIFGPIWLPLLDIRDSRYHALCIRTKKKNNTNTINTDIMSWAQSKE